MQLAAQARLAAPEQLRLLHFPRRARQRRVEAVGHQRQVAQRVLEAVALFGEGLFALRVLLHGFRQRPVLVPLLRQDVFDGQRGRLGVRRAFLVAERGVEGFQHGAYAVQRASGAVGANLFATMLRKGE